MKKEKKEYILQNDDMACTLIALMNCKIDRDGSCPIKYESDEFWKLYKDCDGTESHGIGNVYRASCALDIENIDFPQFESIEHLRIHIIKELRLGKKILFAFPDYEHLFHTVLIVNYSFRYKTFKVINANILGENKPVEYLTWEQLSFDFYYKDFDADSPRSPEEVKEKLKRTCMLSKALV